MVEGLPLNREAFFIRNNFDYSNLFILLIGKAKRHVTL